MFIRLDLHRHLAEDLHWHDFLGEITGRDCPAGALLRAPGELILIGASSLELRKKAIEDGMITLRESGLHKIRAGLTTLEEVVRETVA